MIFMWTKVCHKLRASLYIVQACAHLHKTLYLKGSQKREKLYADTQEEIKPLWFIIKQKTPLQKVWSAVIQVALVYTALYVPFKLAFSSGL